MGRTNRNCLGPLRISDDQITLVKLSRIIRESHHNIEDDKHALEEEIDILGGNVVLIALGRKTEHCLRKYFKDQYRIIYIPHYAIYGPAEDYRHKVLERLSELD